MRRPKFPYVGDAAIRRFLARYDCPTPFHVVRMRFWGAIVSPSHDVSPIKVIESLWPSGLPKFGDADEANGFFQTLMGLWNRMARHQDALALVKLQAVTKLLTRDALHDAAALRVEELRDGFVRGFTGGNRDMDVPPGVTDLLAQVEKAIELLAMTRNTIARPPGPDDAEMVAQLERAIFEVDRALHTDFNPIAVAMRGWRSTSTLGATRRSEKSNYRH